MNIVRKGHGEQETAKHDSNPPHTRWHLEEGTRPQNLVLLIFAPFFFLAIAHVVSDSSSRVPNDTTYPERQRLSFLTTCTQKPVCDPFQPH